MKKILFIALFAALFGGEVMGQTYNQFGTTQNPNEMVMKKKRFREKSLRESGLEQFIEFGAGVDYKDWQTATLDVSYIYGYQLGRAVFVGAGASLQLQPVFEDFYLTHKYKLNRPISVNIPVFLDIKTYIMNRRFSPFIDIRGGYSFGIMPAKMTYTQNWTDYAPDNEDGMVAREDVHTKNWIGTGKFGMVGIGINYKKWDFGVYMPTYVYGRYKYTTEITRDYESTSSVKEKFSNKQSNRRSPIELQLKASLRF